MYIPAQYNAQVQWLILRPIVGHFNTQRVLFIQLIDKTRWISEVTDNDWLTIIQWYKTGRMTFTVLFIPMSGGWSLVGGVDGPHNISLSHIPWVVIIIYLFVYLFTYLFIYFKFRAFLLISHFLAFAILQVARRKCFKKTTLNFTVIIIDSFDAN